MARDYNLKLSKYGISNKQYKYLRSLCERYDEMKSEIQKCYSLQVHHNDINVSTSNKSDATYRQAIKAEELSKKTEAIEQAVIETCPEIYQELLKGVTKPLSYEKLGDIPYSKPQYYKIRRRFFYNLSKRGNI